MSARDTSTGGSGSGGADGGGSGSGSPGSGSPGSSGGGSGAGDGGDPGILSSSAVMAAGTVVSRLSGFVRSSLLVLALGSALHADVFTIANTIPNMLYILLAGGVFNAVLVPQLVRAIRHDPDGGAAYTDRVITLAAVFLAGVSAVLVLLAPLLMRLVLDGSFFTPELAAQRQSAIDFARFCVPQVFFYGMFVLVGQVLNARGSFGPMMWAPIANNVISVAVLGVYLWSFGPVGDLCRADGSTSTAVLAGPGSAVGAYTSSQELLLGLGSTLGIAVQLLILLPYLRRAGVSFHPRFDFRGTGLGRTLRLGTWTVLFVVVNQAAYTVVVKIASSGTAGGFRDACGAHAGAGGTGYTVYSSAFLLVMVPHSVVTVSLATALLPRLSGFAADGDLRGVARSVASTLRTAYAVVIPFALLLPLVALDVSNLVFGYGAARPNVHDFAVSLALFAPGLVLFTTHYLVLRGFYSLERTRTVFWVQCVVAATNVVLALVLTHHVSPADTSPRLVMAYAGAYLVGAAASYALLRRVLGGLQTPVLVRFLVRVLIAAGLAAGVAWAARHGLQQLWPDASGLAATSRTGKLHAVTLLAVTGLVDGAVFLGLARMMRITEVTTVVALLTRRLHR